METEDAIKTEPKESSQLSTPVSTPVPATAAPATTTAATKTKLPSIVLPEVELYLHLLVLIFAIDRQKYKQVNENKKKDLKQFFK